MDNVIDLKPSMNMAETLRLIADEIDSGAIKPDDITLIAIPHVYQIGVMSDEQAAMCTVFNCNYAIQKLMHAALCEDD